MYSAKSADKEEEEEEKRVFADNLPALLVLSARAASEIRPTVKCLHFYPQRFVQLLQRNLIRQHLDCGCLMEFVALWQFDRR